MNPKTKGSASIRFLKVLLLVLLIVAPALLSAPAAAQTELITNGSFGSGSTGWVISANFFSDSRFSTCRSCPGYAYLSNADGSAGNNLVGAVYQIVTIPTTATQATLSFWYNITTQETQAVRFDLFDVTIQNSSGSLLANVASLSNVDQTAGAYRQRTFDMTPFRGQTIRVHFRGTTDLSLPTTFRIDDVSPTYNSPPPPQLAVGPGSLNFGNVQVGSCSTAPFAIQHVLGTGPALGTASASPNPPFTIVSNSSFSVSNGLGINVEVRFCPSSLGSFSGSATVSSPGTTFTGPNAVALSGTGFIPPPTTGAIQVNATLNGSPWSGNVNYTLNGPVSFAGNTVPADFQGRSAGSYNFAFTSGGPASASLSSITPSSTQILSGGQTINFTMNFVSNPVPVAPSNLIATALSSSTASLAWTDNSSNETGFKIERKIGTSGTYGQVGTQGANLNSFNESALAGSTQYCYRVKAYNAAGDSAFSNESCTTTSGTGTGSFYLSFPLAGRTPYTANITSVFDHSMSDRYTADGQVIAYTGELGNVIDSNESPTQLNGQTLYSFKKPLGTPANQQSFLINGHYVGTLTTGPTTINYDGHPGYDYPVVVGTEVYAAADGEVVVADSSNSTASGNYVRLEHPAAGYQTQYLHLSEILVSVGATVNGGQLIGRSGNTAGPGATVGAHLHFEVKKLVSGSWISVDPYGWQGSGSDPYTAAASSNLWNNGIVFVELAGICNGNTPCFSSIQQAIDAAGDGTTIKVAQGAYHENLFVNSSANFTFEGGWNTSFTLRSRNPALTVIDGDINGDGVGDGGVFAIIALSGVDIGLEIDGFTIQNGGERDGGGVFGWASSGGSLELNLTNNIIKNNQATNSGAGVGVYAQDSGTAAHATLTNNMIFGNDSGGNGGGVYAYADLSGELTMTLTNNTITDNAAVGVGGGLRVYASRGSVNNVTVKNSIIWGNTAATGHDIAVRQSVAGIATVNSSFNDAGDVLPDATGPGTYNDLGNNVDNDPLFVNLIGGDLRLGAGSPAIDAGTSTDAPVTDFEGQARPQGAGYDMGADERIPPPPLQVQVPNRGEIWPIRSIQTIRWNSSGITGNVKIQLSRNGGLTWTTLFTGTANDGGQNWTVTKPATSQARIRVCSVKTPSICDASDASFTIR